VPRLVRADALERVLLEDAQELHLRPGGKLADLVEEHRSTGCQLQPALLCLERSRECASLVSEEFALQEILGDRPTVDHHERPSGPRTVAVDGARDELLPRPGLPVTRTVASEGTTIPIILNSCCIAGWCPMRSPSPSGASRRRSTSVRSWLTSTARWAVSSTSWASNGLPM